MCRQAWQHEVLRAVVAWHRVRYVGERPQERLIITAEQFSQDHLDGTSMVRDHRGDEIAVDVDHWSDSYVGHYFVHGCVVRGEEVELATCSNG